MLPRWGIDWDAIASNGRDATFNVYNVTSQQLETFSPAEMNAERLLAGVTLPSWFPQQVIDGDVYIDSVYATDANLESAIQRGANELWIIWTMSGLGVLARAAGSTSTSRRSKRPRQPAERSRSRASRSSTRSGAARSESR